MPDVAGQVQEKNLSVDGMKVINSMLVLNMALDDAEHHLLEDLKTQSQTGLNEESFTAQHRNRFKKRAGDYLTDVELPGEVEESIDSFISGRFTAIYRVYRAAQTLAHSTGTVTAIDGPSTVRGQLLTLAPSPDVDLDELRARANAKTFNNKRDRVVYMLNNATPAKGFPLYFCEEQQSWERLPSYKEALKANLVTSHMGYIEVFFGSYLNHYNGGDGDFINQAEMEKLIPNGFRSVRSTYSKQNTGAPLSTIIPAKFSKSG